MFNTFNMGVGMIVCVSAQQEAAALRILKENGEQAYTIGEITDTEGISLW